MTSTRSGGVDRNQGPHGPGAPWSPGKVSKAGRDAISDPVGVCRASTRSRSRCGWSVNARRGQRRTIVTRERIPIAQRIIDYGQATAPASPPGLPPKVRSRHGLTGCASDPQ